MLKKFIGNREFYKRVIALSLPIMIQNGITNFVNMLDNVMVGQVGTVQMTGVAIANQLIFVFNLCVFGALSGAGIFGAQFFGNGDHKGVRYTFRFKLVTAVVLSIIGVVIFLSAGEPLISLYLRGEGAASDAAASLEYSKRYLHIMLIGICPWALSQAYASTLRETGKSLPPMIAGVVAVLVNLALNYVLIFGHFGAPALGVEGAAIATVISRFCELLFIAVYTAFTKKQNKFIVGAFKSLFVPLYLVKNIFVKGIPLMLNETLWASGFATLNQCYSERGLSVVAANNISQTFWNVFSVAFLAIGVSIGIILGQMLGAGETEKAREYSYKLIFFTTAVSVVFGVVYFFAAKFIPQIYNTDEEIRILATRLMQICAIAMPIDAFAHAAYFTLRSGGRVFITFLFDSGFVWAVSVPVIMLLTKLTALPILYIFTISQLLNIIKCVLGIVFVKRGIWIRRIVGENE